MTKEDINFLRREKNADAIDAGNVYVPNLENFKRDFGVNFNTLIILNTSGEQYSLSLDGIKVGDIAPNNGILSFDWRDGIIYSEIKLTNEDGSAQTSASEIFLTIGRTGIKDGI